MFMVYSTRGPRKPVLLKYTQQLNTPSKPQGEKLRDGLIDFDRLYMGACGGRMHGDSDGICVHGCCSAKRLSALGFRI